MKLNVLSLNFYKESLNFACLDRDYNFNFFRIFSTTYFSDCYCSLFFLTTVKSVSHFFSCYLVSNKSLNLFMKAGISLVLGSKLIFFLLCIFKENRFWFFYFISGENGSKPSGASFSKFTDYSIDSDKYDPSFFIDKK